MAKESTRSVSRRKAGLRDFKSLVDGFLDEATEMLGTLRESESVVTGTQDADLIRLRSQLEASTNKVVDDADAVLYRLRQIREKGMF